MHYLAVVLRGAAARGACVAFALDALHPLGGYPGDDVKARELFGELDQAYPGCSTASTTNAALRAAAAALAWQARWPSSTSTCAHEDGPALRPRRTCSASRGLAR